MLRSDREKKNEVNRAGRFLSVSFEASQKKCVEVGVLREFGKHLQDLRIIAETSFLSETKYTRRRWLGFFRKSRGDWNRSDFHSIAKFEESKSQACNRARKDLSLFSSV